ncbi:putative PEP-binding protein [Spirochaeta cellobiosiphila]|uniref:putative PEP-binding protein n=1 Tax=Spirochaeta cellobiosiphila TaxID=504483 RepID=UPI00040F28CD|nr:putative PEP-binding protein [Spirochaeta cellobiosiphila]
MKSSIHFFGEGKTKIQDNCLENIGYRGRQAVALDKMKLPILPGFIIDSEVSSTFDSKKLEPVLKSNLGKLEKKLNKELGSKENPLLLKVVVSPNLQFSNYPPIHNIGLVEPSLEGFIKHVGDNFALHEVHFLLRGVLDIEAKIAELESNEDRLKSISDVLKIIEKQIITEENSDGKMPPAATQKKTISNALELFPDEFSKDAFFQLNYILERIKCLIQLEEKAEGAIGDSETALLIQPMVYGNYGKNSGSGLFFTRNIVTGEKVLQGTFFKETFNELGSEGMDVNKVSKKHIQTLKEIRDKIEKEFKEIRSIRFTIEDDNLWLIDQRPVHGKSTRADIRVLLDLLADKVIDDKYAINSIKPSQLNELLHPMVDTTSVKGFKSITGGISGAPGSAIGKVYFTTEGITEAYKEAVKTGGDKNLILCMAATYADDVKAVEMSNGVLSCEGGYSAHASVVARQYGKVSLVKPDMKITGKKATIGNVTIKEGDYITLDVPYYGDPTVYLGTADLIEPDPKESGLLDLVALVKKYVTDDFFVRVNADNAKSADLALKFGAEGIGLCRTEHMFFQEERINLFRHMILAEDKKERVKVLNKLKTIQKKDFYEIFKVMSGKEVTIRLLDAPLHEFMPHTKEQLDSFKEYLTSAGINLTKSQLDERTQRLEEVNPMLGHRGSRIAVSYPEIYEMQISAIFEAAHKAKKEGVEVLPEIMVPLIMNSNEIKLLVFGKKIEGLTYKGLLEVSDEVQTKAGDDPIPFKVGTMIELPAAAVGAGEISKYAQFFSFGTNDLTQTTLGLSRDDFNAFMPDYTQFDLIEGNPFQKLDSNVKELIKIAVRRGSLTRPDLKTGLCGEHGANPDNIKFCMDAGLNYVSCSVYSVPIANLAIAQMNLSE